MEIAAYSFGLLALALGTAMSIASLNSHKYTGLWFGVATIIAAVLGGGCWLHDYWAKADAEKDANATPVTNDQRPWLDVAAIVLDELTADEKQKISLVFRNNGKTPAIIKSTRPAIVGSRVPIDFDLALSKYATEAKVGERETFIAPGAFARFWMGDTTGSSVILSKKTLEAIKQGTQTLVLIETVKYTDATDGEYETRFCGFYDITIKDFITHNEHNYMT